MDGTAAPVAAGTTITWMTAATVAADVTMVTMVDAMANKTYIYIY
jgi:hypothetical protein